jgi:hypothetical protein
MQLSPHSLRKWPDRLDAGEVTIDRRAYLHPPARPPLTLVLGTQPPNAA